MAARDYLPKTLEFSERDTRKHLELRDAILRDTMHEYATYRQIKSRSASTLSSTWSSSSDNPPPQAAAVVDPRVWKLVRQQNDLTVYKDHRDGLRQSARLRQVGGRHATVHAKHHVPQILMTGSVPGTVDDAMYGGFAQSEYDLRMRASYLQEEITDVKLLHAFEGPSAEDPFRFCGLVWYTYSKQSRLPFTRARDAVMLYSTGLATSEDGETVGFTVMQSVPVKTMPSFDQFHLVRGHGLMTLLKRQRDRENVELFARGFLAPMGDIPESTAVTMAVKAFLTAARTADAAHSRKLFWLMQEARRTHPQRPRDLPTMWDNSTCAGECEPATFRTWRRHKGMCLICQKSVCSSCRASRELTVAVTADTVQQRTLTFCLSCVENARIMNARLIAGGLVSAAAPVARVRSAESTREQSGHRHQQSKSTESVSFLASSHPAPLPRASRPRFLPRALSDIESVDSESSTSTDNRSYAI